MKKNNIFERILLLLFSINLVAGILWHTTISAAGSMLYIQEVVTSVLFFLTILFKKTTLENIIVGSVCLVATFISWKANSADFEYFFMVLLMSACGTLSPKKMLKITAVVGSITLIIVFILSKIGIIDNLTFIRNGVVREAFGTMHPLNFGAFVLYIIVAIALIYNRKSSNFVWPVIILAISFLVNKYTNARNDSVCLMIIALLLLINFDKIPGIKQVTKIAGVIAISLSVISVFVSKIIYNNTTLYFQLNKLFSGRVYIQDVLFNNYKLTILGQNIPQVGLGGQTASINNYFYIDNSWTRFCFMGGVVFWMAMLYIVSKFIFRIIDLGLYRQAWIILVIIISAISEDTFSTLGTNLLIPIFLCSDRIIKEDMKYELDVLSNKPLLEE